MTPRWSGRGPFGLVLRRVLRIAALPTLAATVLAWASRCAVATPGAAPGDGASAAASGWLSLPLLVAVLTTALGTVVFWPLFGRQRPGADWLRHRQRGPLRGTGAAVLGALTAQLLLTLPVALLLPAWLGAPPLAHPHVVLTPPAPAVLDAGTGPLRFAPPVGRRWQELQLRPLAGLPTGPLQPTTIAVHLDGRPLATAVAFTESWQLAAVPLAEATIGQLELHRTGGTVPLLFGPDSTVLVGSDGHPAWQNGIWLALLALLPTFVALAIGGLVGGVSGLPTVLTVVAGLGFLLTAGDLGPFGPGLRMLLRGHWLPAGAVFPMCPPLLAVGSLSMLAAMVLRPGSGR